MEFLSLAEMGKNKFTSSVPTQHKVSREVEVSTWGIAAFMNITAVPQQTLKERRGNIAF